MSKHIIGYYGVFNTGCLGTVVSVEFGITDSVLLGNGRLSQIRYTADGNAYFLSYGQRWYLDDIIRA